MAETLEDAEPSRREKPWLLLHNRRLRHLQGITIRNLSFEQKQRQSRGRTFDDEALPFTLQSPTKKLAQLETKALPQSRSSTNLSAEVVEDGSIRVNARENEEASVRMDQSPTKSHKLKRRNTLGFGDATMEYRRKRMGEAINSRMADSFFSLHVEGVEEPIYVSEEMEKAMNPNFKFFDLDSCGPEITRLEDLCIRVWSKNTTMSQYILLIELTLNLRSLQFIGKTLDTYRHTLPTNTVLFHLTDGIYTTPLPTPNHLPIAPPTARHTTPSTTSSYDALQRLSTLDACIADALHTRDNLTTSISDLLTRHHASMRTVAELPEAEERLRTVEAAVTSQRKRLEAARRRRDDLASSITTRRSQIAQGRATQSAAQAYIRDEKPNLTKTQNDIRELSVQTTGQRRRIMEDLQAIYPIEPVAGKSLAFTIRGAYLPNASLDDVVGGAEDSVAAALGHVAQVVSLLSAYLECALPYPVTPRGSNSVAHDPISAVEDKARGNAGGGGGAGAIPRTYPLYARGTARFRFEYGVFLLNKDIEILSNWMGLRIVDLRHTLPNLKYLLFVAGAGAGEVPTRKRGGIRALSGLGVSLRGRGGEERRDSVDSTATGETVSSKTAVADGVRDGKERKVDGMSTNGGRVAIGR